MSWNQVVAFVDKRCVDEITALMEAAGAISVSCQDAADEPLLEPLPGETPLWDCIELTAMFESDADLSILQEVLSQHRDIQADSIRIEKLADRDWSNTWRENFSAMRFGQHLWVCPTGEEPDDDQATVIRLDPGLAFGTGTHATTAMCLDWLDANPPSGRQVIDYGCGSGILAIAACCLGAGEVHAVDIDPQALVATRDNAQRNRIDARLVVSEPEALENRQVDLVLANILANPLVELSGTLCGHLRCGGNIVMTGILADQADSVLDAYRTMIEFSQPLQQGDWVLLSGRRI